MLEQLRRNARPTRITIYSISKRGRDKEDATVEGTRNVKKERTTRAEEQIETRRQSTTVQVENQGDAIPRDNSK